MHDPGCQRYRKLLKNHESITDHFLTFVWPSCFLNFAIEVCTSDRAHLHFWWPLPVVHYYPALFMQITTFAMPVPLNETDRLAIVHPHHIPPMLARLSLWTPVMALSMARLSWPRNSLICSHLSSELCEGKKPKTESITSVVMTPEIVYYCLIFVQSIQEVIRPCGM